MRNIPDVSMFTHLYSLSVWNTMVINLEMLFQLKHLFICVADDDVDLDLDTKHLTRTNIHYHKCGDDCDDTPKYYDECKQKGCLIRHLDFSRIRHYNSIQDSN